MDLNNIGMKDIKVKKRIDPEDSDIDGLFGDDEEDTKKIDKKMAEIKK